MYLMLEIHCQFVWLFALLLQQVVNYQGQQPGNECPTKGKKINLHYNILQFIKHDKELKNKWPQKIRYEKLHNTKKDKKL